MPRKPAQPNPPAAATRNDIVVYENGSDVRLEVRTDGETVWLTQGQICELFGVVKSNVSYHLKNIFASGELDRAATVQKIRTVQTEGPRQVVRDLEFFNLDVVISIGYRVNSIRATLFRQWATRVLRSRIRKANRPAFGESVRLASSVRSRLRRSVADVRQGRSCSFSQTGVSSFRFHRAALPREKTDARPTRRAVTRGAVGLAKSRVQQLTAPPPDPPRRKIGFAQAERNRKADEFSRFIETVHIRVPEGWKFDREEANARKRTT